MTTMSENTAVTLKAIQIFVALQTRIWGAFRMLIFRDYRLLLDLPSAGQFDVDTEEWRFLVHGTGVRFERNGIVVDMNKGVDLGPGVFDAGRLFEYYDSRPCSSWPLDHNGVAARLRNSRSHSSCSRMRWRADAPRAGTVGTRFGPKSAGAALNVTGRVLQSGGRKLSKSTADGLNKATGSSLNSREWGRARNR